MFVVVISKGFRLLVFAPLNHQSFSQKRRLKLLLQGQSCYKSELIYTINFPHGMLCFLLAKTVYFPLHCTCSVVIALSCNYTPLETDFTRTVLKREFKALGHEALVLME